MRKSILINYMFMASVAFIPLMCVFQNNYYTHFSFQEA